MAWRQPHWAPVPGTWGGTGTPCQRRSEPLRASVVAQQPQRRGRVAARASSAPVRNSATPGRSKCEPAPPAATPSRSATASRSPMVDVLTYVVSLHGYFVSRRRRGFPSLAVVAGSPGGADGRSWGTPRTPRTPPWWRSHQHGQESIGLMKRCSTRYRSAPSRTFFERTASARSRRSAASQLDNLRRLFVGVFVHPG